MLKALKRRAALSCSFCGKPADQVGRLMAGAATGSHICDACVGVCVGILDATPDDFTGWDRMSEDQLLAGLSVSEATVEATRRVLQAQIDALRHRGVSWERIGAALGISRQAAWERFS